MGTQEENESHQYLWNPATSQWEAAKVGGSVSGTVAVSNFPATQPVSGNVGVNNFPATQPVSGNVGVNNFPATQPVSMAAPPAGTTPVSMAAPPGGTTAVSMAAAPGGTTAVSMAAPPTPTSSGTGALTNHRLVSAATTNATNVKSTGGRLYSGHMINSSASAKYVKIYNKATAPVPGTDTPILTLLIPPTATVRFEFGVYGRFFNLGLGLAITGGVADSDTTAVAVADVITHLDYL